MKKVENSEKLAAWCGLVYGFRRFYMGIWDPGTFPI